MDWPHDPDGDEGSEGGRKYGLAIIAKQLDADDFPLDKAACLERFGDHPIRLDHETVIEASEALDGIDDGPYESQEELLTAIGSAMREAGLWTFERERYAD